MTATAQPTDAKSAEPVERLRAEEPLSRESLYDAEIVEALWREAEENPQTGAASVFECAEIYRAFEHRTAHTYEIATALDYHGVCNVPDKRTSAAFREEIARHDSE